MLHRAIALVPLLLVGCAEDPDDSCLHTEAELSIEIPAHQAQALVDCSVRSDTGYSHGSAFAIDVVTVDSKPVELDTGNAYWVMKQAAANDGVNIAIVSGFRTMAQQEYLYGCYVNCNCNNCNLAAPPGYSNHQSGHALDLNTSAGSVYNWLASHAGGYGFSRTVPSEPWHWEWWGGGPGGGICGITDPECVAAPSLDECSGSVMRRCVGGQYSTGDCGAFGAACSTLGGDAHCVHPACFATGENSTFCTDATHIATCDLGSYGVGDCAAYGGTCSTAGTDHCVNYFCNAVVGAEDGRGCTDDDQLVVCSGGAAEMINCGPGYGGSCVDDEAGARCVHPYCNVFVGEETGSACTEADELIVCDDGQAELINCAPGYGGSCVDDDAGARCVHPYCNALVGAETGTACMENDELVVCNDGAAEIVSCAPGYGGACADDGEDHCVHPYCNAVVGAETGRACTDDDQLIVCEDGDAEVINCAPGYGGSCVDDGDARCVHPYCNAFVGAETGSACTEANELIVCESGTATLTACGAEPCNAPAATCGDPPAGEGEGEDASEGEGEDASEGEGEDASEGEGEDASEGESGEGEGETGGGCAGAPAGSPAVLALTLVLLRRRRALIAPLVALVVAGCAPDDMVMGEGLALAEDHTISQAATACAAGPTLFGIDVSYYQGDINWGAVANAGVRYAIIRVSDGTSFNDPRFAEYWSGAAAAGIPRGAYQFFRPNHDPIAQANLVIAKLQQHGMGELPPVIDVEATGGQSPAVVAAKVGQWIAHIESQLGVRPIIYSGKYFWQDNVGNTAQFNSYPLWHAQYTSASCPNIADAWPRWAFWQYSSSGSVAGIAGNVDVNRFNGTLQDLLALGGGTDPECEAAPNLNECSGSVIRECNGGQFSTGDCGAFGAACSTLGGDAHCVHPLCIEPGENSTTCTDDTHIATCELGAYGVGDCAAYGGTCSTVGVDHCVNYYCNVIVGAEEGRGCTDDDQLVVCSGGQAEFVNCGPGFGGSCVDDGDARCVHPYCNVFVGAETGTACTEANELIVCEDGAAELINCAPGYGGSCVDGDPVDLDDARCVHPYCNVIVGAETGRGCTDDDQLVVCTDGAAELLNCAPGYGGSCVDDGDGPELDARCVHPYCNVFVGAETGSACTENNELVVCDGGAATLTACGADECNAAASVCGDPPPLDPPGDDSGEGEGGEGEGEGGEGEGGEGEGGEGGEGEGGEGEGEGGEGEGGSGPSCASAGAHAGWAAWTAGLALALRRRREHARGGAGTRAR